MIPVPTLTKELIDYLETLYPDKAPDISMEERRIWYVTG